MERGGAEARGEVDAFTHNQRRLRYHPALRPAGVFPELLDVQLDVEARDLLSGLYVGLRLHGGGSSVLGVDGLNLKQLRASRTIG